MSKKEEFIQIFMENIHREDADKLLAWLKKSDFFTAPASTRFHGAHEGGLCEHSVNVFERLRELVGFERDYSDRFMLGAGNTLDNETIAICGLLHDVCKANFYKTSTRNVKNEQTGQWEKQPFYMVEDQLPYGHGEKSVYIVSGFMRLTREEAMAIRWHMGGFDDSVKGGSYAMSSAFEKYPLAVLMHIADLQATYLDENREDQK